MGVPLYIIPSSEVLPNVQVLGQGDRTDDLSTASFASTLRTRCVKLLKSLTLPKYTIFIVFPLLGAYLCLHDKYTAMDLVESFFKVLKRQNEQKNSL